MAKNYPEADRRLFPRWIIEGSAVLSFNNSPQEPVVVNDICPRGAGIFCNHPIDIGAEVDIEISCFFDKVVQKKAKVIWCTEVDKGFWRVGLDFGLNDLLEFDKPPR